MINPLAPPKKINIKSANSSKAAFVFRVKVGTSSLSFGLLVDLFADLFKVFSKRFWDPEAVESAARLHQGMR